MESWLTPLYDAAGMRAADSWAIDEQGVPSLELMEAAGSALAEGARDRAAPGPIRVVCGKGNNGGDGLVAARRLLEWGFEVEALLLWPSDELSPDAAASLRRFEGPVREVTADQIASVLNGAGAVIDAIFGTGFEGAPRDPAAAAIKAINAEDTPVIATDVSSGVNASSAEVEGEAVAADLTVTFHAPKIGHWVAPGKWFAGELRVAEIGIPPSAPSQPAAGLIGDAALSLLPRRGRRSTKFTSGQVLVVGGSRGLTGAVCMSAQAAIRAGAGYATVAVPAELEPIFESKLTEVMSLACPGPGKMLGPEAAERILEAAERARAVVLGPGLGRAEESFELARAIVSRLEAPLVLDADGLNALAGHLGPLQARSTPAVVTPHAGELARLIESDSDHVAAHRVACAQGAATATGAVVVLKGDDTLVVEADGEERLAVNGLSASALATAGTGDVLSGMIAALIARGLEPFEAACAAVHAHSRAGLIAAARVGAAESVIAGDVIEAIPEALG